VEPPPQPTLCASRHSGDTLSEGPPPAKAGTRVEGSSSKPDKKHKIEQSSCQDRGFFPGSENHFHGLRRLIHNDIVVR